ncbi:unnamed protein product [Polarella glacialis]|uniref:Protein kinase domain-containing protein n=1 Tax=Polarella glacialis TaxID=89957 RepID=A0A813L0K9_POLGL|nr:unnamed protein product [Polarella glacialis]
MCTNLLNNVCDAYAWLQEDGDTVLESQSHADNLMLREMLPPSKFGVEGGGRAGIKISSLLGAGDVARFAQMMSRMQCRAVSLIHVTLQSWDVTDCISKQTSADLFLLKWPVPLESGLRQRHFLVGIRQQRQQECHGADDDAEDCDDGSGTCVGDRIPVLQTWQNTQLQEETQITKADHTGSSGTSGKPASSMLFNDICTADPSLNLLAMMAVGRAETWIIRAEDLALEASGTKLGQGAYGMVLMGKYFGADVALKSRSSPANVIRSLESLGNELKVLRHLRHPHLVAFYGACFIESSCDFLLVEEFVQGQSLEHMLTDIHPPDVRRRAGILQGICKALCYMHAQLPCVVHGDLKPDNVLLEQPNAHPKLIDFGLSRRVKHGSNTMGGTLRYCAPEVFSRVHPSPSTDMFSFGRLAFQMMTLRCPCEGLSANHITTLARRGEIPDLDWPVSPGVLQAECQQLCLRCLAFQPLERPDAQETLKELLNWQMSSTSGCFHQPVQSLATAQQSKILALVDSLKAIRNKPVAIAMLRSGPKSNNTKLGMLIAL